MRDERNPVWKYEQTYADLRRAEQRGELEVFYNSDEHREYQQAEREARKRFVWAVTGFVGAFAVIVAVVVYAIIKLLP